MDFERSNIEGDIISFEFDTLFGIWEAMPPEKLRDDIEVNLRRSPLFLQKEITCTNAIIQRVRGEEGTSELEMQVRNSERSIGNEGYELETLVHSLTGEEGGRLILNNINCNIPTPGHANTTVQSSDTHAPLLIEPANSATRNWSQIGGPGLSDLLKFQIDGAGHEKSKA